MESAEVSFRQRAFGIVSLLEVISPRRLSVLDPVRGLLFELRVQIIRVESIVQGNGLVERFHIVEFDGAPIVRHRASSIRAAVRRILREQPAEAAA